MCVCVCVCVSVCGMCHVVCSCCSSAVDVEDLRRLSSTLSLLASEKQKTKVIHAFMHSYIELLAGRCYGAEICTILLLLRCPFRWYAVLQKSKCSDSGHKPWSIVRRFG